MKRWLVMAMLVGLAGNTRAETPIESLVAAERAFAKTSVTTSMRGAFLAFLAPDGIVFRPGPVNGPEFYTARPENKVVLAWEPVVGEISAAGDMGFTTGPWSFRSAPDADPTAYGHYVSVWKKQKDGSWKVAIDVGVGHDKPVTTTKTDFRPARGKLEKGVVLIKARATLGSADKALATAVATSGVSGALTASAADDIRVYRMNDFPFAGKLAIPVDATRPVMVPLGMDVASSGDFGYTYGSVTAMGATEPASYYLRIWRAETGVWKVILDLDSPVPPKE